MSYCRTKIKNSGAETDENGPWCSEKAHLEIHGGWNGKKHILHWTHNTRTKPEQDPNKFRPSPAAKTAKKHENEQNPNKSRTSLGPWSTVNIQCINSCLPELPVLQKNATVKVFESVMNENVQKVLGSNGKTQKIIQITCFKKRLFENVWKCSKMVENAWILCFLA